MSSVAEKDYFEDNLSLLRSHDPALFRRVRALTFPQNVEVITTREDVASLRFKSVTLHSAYHPLKEAAESVSRFELRQSGQVVVYGLGFGYHVLELLGKSSGQILIVEPLLPVFRAFLSKVNLAPFLPRVRFHIAEPTPRIVSRYRSSDWDIYRHLPSVRLSPDYFERMDRSRDLQGLLSARRVRALVVPPFYGGSLPTAKFCARALENLGHEVDMVECDRFAESFFALSDVTRDKGNADILSRLFMTFIGQVILAKASDFKPDMVFVMAQAPMTAETISRLKELNVPVVFWFVEDFRVLKYWRDIASSYDHFFTIQRGEFSNLLEQAGCRNNYYLPQACMADMHKPTSLSENQKKDYSCDLSFMGAGYYNRRKAFPRLVDFDFKIWGTGWDLNSELGRHIQKKGEKVSTEETVLIYNGTKINLNLHSSSFHEGVNEKGDFVNNRTFEIAACSGFQLVDEREELPDLFNIGEEMITYNSMDDLRRKIEYYLERPEERKEIAERARKRVLREHTFESRMAEMLLQVFADDVESLRRRLEERTDRVDYFIEEAGSETELGRYLGKFRNSADFSIKQMVQDIEKGEGDLSKTELLLLMLDQVTKEE